MKWPRVREEEKSRNEICARDSVQTIENPGVWFFEMANNSDNPSVRLGKERACKCQNQERKGTSLLTFQNVQEDEQLQ